MPKHTEVIQVTEANKEKLLEQALAAMQNLDWSVLFADENSIVAHTPKKWNKWNDEITVVASEAQLQVTSAMIHDEQWDWVGQQVWSLLLYLPGRRLALIRPASASSIAFSFASAIASGDAKKPMCASPTFVQTRTSGCAIATSVLISPA